MNHVITLGDVVLAGGGLLVIALLLGIGYYLLSAYGNSWKH